MRKRICGFIRLTRFQEFLAFVFITTLMGAIAAEGTLSWKLFTVLLANQLAVCFAFMINDVEDAEDDALNPAKVARNPVSSRDVSRRSGYFYSLFVAILALVCFAFLGWKPFLLGVSALLIGFLYSWKPVRLKNVFLVDMVSHCLMLAGLQYLPAYYSFQSRMTLRGLFPLIFVILFSLYGELFNELRDLEHDMKAGLRHTAATLGYQITFRLMISIALTGILCGIITLFFIHLLPIWLIITLFVLVLLSLLRSWLKSHSAQSQLEIQQSVQKPIVYSAVIGCSLYFLIPPLLHLLKLG